MHWLTSSEIWLLRMHHVQTFCIFCFILRKQFEHYFNNVKVPFTQMTCICLGFINQIKKENLARKEIFPLFLVEHID